MALGQEALQALIEPVVQALECELWGIEYFRAGQRSVLRVYVDKAGGVDIEDCQRISRQLGSVFDVEDPIGDEYTLEVSSPGLARPLYTFAQYEKLAGEHVDLQLRFPFEGQRKFKGLLKGVEAEDVVLVVGEQEYLFPFDSIEKAKVVPQF
ncbi:ribosome maturation factor RimP [Gammaproteobacteria bacterium 50_400_T64]|mgnify:CR=1 FL=1|nr:ribosome maturation factor RimP [Gammaproteobacteria bacterium 50_400_T64]